MFGLREIGGVEESIQVAIDDEEKIEKGLIWCKNWNFGGRRKMGLNRFGVRVMKGEDLYKEEVKERPRTRTIMENWKLKKKNELKRG